LLDGPRCLPSTRAAPAHVRRLLDALGSYPSYAITFGWDIAAWNDACEALYPSVATMPSEERNLLRLVFTDPDVRALLPDWEVDSRRFLAQFRAEAGPRLSDPSLSALVSHLLVASAVFARLWDIHDIEPFTTRNRRFRHSLVGDLLLEHHRLTPSGEPDLNVVVYTPANETSTTHLRELLMTTTS